MTDDAEPLVGRFLELTGTTPMGVWRAPGRVNLIGEHTDYNGGSVLPIAIDREARAALRVRDDGLVHVWSEQRGEAPIRPVASLAPGPARGWEAYVHGVVWAFRERGVNAPGLDILIDSTVPAGAGLSSSAALEVAVAVALRDALEVAMDPWDVVHLARRAENGFVGVPSGVMDQAIAVFGHRGTALLLDASTLETRQVPLWRDREVVLVVIDPGVPHRLVDDRYAERVAECREAADRLGVSLASAASGSIRSLPEPLSRRARHVITEQERVRRAVAALEDDDVATLGGLIDASHGSLRDDMEVVAPEQDLAVQAARTAGVLGARMVGAGFGGSCIALTPASLVPAVRGAVRDVLARASSRADTGSVEVFPVTSAAGAGRIV